jgi:hypothetical protein
MTEVEAAMVLRGIRIRVAESHGMTIIEMRSQVAASEERDRRRKPMAPTVHQKHGGLACEGC